MEVVPSVMFVASASCQVVLVPHCRADVRGFMFPVSKPAESFTLLRPEVIATRGPSALRGVQDVLNERQAALACVYLLDRAFMTPSMTSTLSCVSQLIRILFAEILMLATSKGETRRKGSSP